MQESPVFLPGSHLQIVPISLEAHRCPVIPQACEGHMSPLHICLDAIVGNHRPPWGPYRKLAAPVVTGKCPEIHEAGRAWGRAEEEEERSLRWRFFITKGCVVGRLVPQTSTSSSLEAMNMSPYEEKETLQMWSRLTTSRWVDYPGPSLVASPSKQRTFPSWGQSQRERWQRGRIEEPQRRWLWRQREALGFCVPYKGPRLGKYTYA